MERDCGVFREKYFSSPEYCFYEERLSTFVCWPLQISPNKFELAECGFYYTGQGDVVKCFSCGIKVCQWLVTDDARKEHLKYSPNCIFLKMIGASSIFGRTTPASQPCANFDEGYNGVTRDQQRAPIIIPSAYL